MIAIRSPRREPNTLAALGTEEKALRVLNQAETQENLGFSSLLWFTNKSSQRLKIQFTLVGLKPKLQPLPMLKELCLAKPKLHASLRPAYLITLTQAIKPSASSESFFSWIFPLS